MGHYSLNGIIMQVGELKLKQGRYKKVSSIIFLEKEKINKYIYMTNKLWRPVIISKFHHVRIKVFV